MFASPYTWADALARQSQGEATLLAIVDSGDAPGRDLATQAVFAALIHLGLPYRLHDLAEGPLTAGATRDHAAILLAQEGVAAALGDDGARAVLAALEAGAGLVSLDSRLPENGTLAAALGLNGGAEAVTAAVRAPTNDHFITHVRVPGEEVTFLRPTPLRPATGGRALLTGAAGEPALLAGRHGYAKAELWQGRWAHWCLAQQLWLNDYLGHANGLDDLFWRAIVWAARKPFAMKAMPPYVTMRVDDCQGQGGFWWNVQQGLLRNPPHIPAPLARMVCDIVPGQSSVANHFEYIDVFNRHGIIPAIGLFIDQVSDDDRPILKRYFDAGKADFSVHAFSEYTSYDVLPLGPLRDREEHRATEFLYHRAWHHEDGKPVIDEYTPEELTWQFLRADRFWAETGIRPARVVNTHYVNPGVNSLPFLKARGQDMTNFAALFGRWYESHYRDAWSRAPYGSIGLVFDYMPVPEGIAGIGPRDFFCAEAHVYDTRRLVTHGRIDDGDIDFTANRTMKGIARDDNDLQAAADNIINQVRVGLDSMFFGCMMAHEQGLAVLTVPEMDEILTITDRALSRHDMRYASYDHIAERARGHVDTRVERAAPADGGVAVTLAGSATAPVSLYLWRDDGDGCRYELHDVPPFAGTTSMTVR